MKTELIAFSLIGLALMSFACAEEEDKLSDTRNEINDIDMILPFEKEHLRDTENIYPSVHLVSNTNGHGCTGILDVNHDWMFSDSEYLIVAEQIEGVGTVTCSQYGGNSSVLKVRVVTVFGQEPLPREMNLILRGGTHFKFEPGKQNLMALIYHDDQFFISKSLPLEKNQDIVRDLDSKNPCVKNNFKGSLFDIQENYLQYQEPMEESKEIRVLGISSISCTEQTPQEEPIEGEEEQ